MNVLCDTCSILMVIRIAPDMFINDKYDCITINEVRKEIFQTQKFKSKYPWKLNYKDKIITINIENLKSDDFKYFYEVINNSINAGIINKDSNRLYDLSTVDQIIAAYTLSNNFEISTGDTNLSHYLYQEFSKKSISALGLINLWIKKGILVWTTEYQKITELWDSQGERPQPVIDVKEFESLSGFKYAGPVESKRYSYMQKTRF